MEELPQLLARMLDKDLHNRPSAKECKEHRFFRLHRGERRMGQAARLTVLVPAYVVYLASAQEEVVIEQRIPRSRLVADGTPTRKGGMLVPPVSVNIVEGTRRSTSHGRDAAMKLSPQRCQHDARDHSLGCRAVTGGSTSRMVDSVTEPSRPRSPATKMQSAASTPQHPVQTRVWLSTVQHAGKTLSAAQKALSPKPYHRKLVHPVDQELHVSGAASSARRHRPSVGRLDSQNNQVPHNTFMAWNRQASVESNPGDRTPATHREVQRGPAMRALSKSPPRLILQSQTMQERSSVIRSPCKTRARHAEHSAASSDVVSPHDGVTATALSAMARPTAAGDMGASGRQLQTNPDLRPSSVHRSRSALLKADNMSWQPPSRYPASPQGSLLLQPVRWTSTGHPGDEDFKRISSPTRVVHREVR